MHHATAHSKRKKKKKTLIAWAAELSWGLEAPFEGTTVADLKVKVPPGVLISGTKKKSSLKICYWGHQVTHGHPNFLVRAIF